MVHQHEPPDSNDPNLIRLRNSAIGPWIDYSNTSSERNVDDEESHRTNSQELDETDLSDLEQEDIMLEVGNLTLVDENNDDAHEYSRDSYNDVIIEQSQENERSTDSDIAITSEPQNVSIIYFDDAELHQSTLDPTDAITVHDYNRVLELSSPLEFSIPNVELESETDVSRMDNFISDFETSLNRIEDIQREIDEIRMLYNNLLEGDHFAEAETIIDFNEIGQVNEDIDNPDSQEQEEFLEDDSILSPINGRQSRLDNIGSFSDFFHQLSQIDNVYDDMHHFENEESAEEDDSIVSSSWQYDDGILIRQHLSSPRRNQLDTRLPNFFLDSNGIPRIEFEMQLNRPRYHNLSNDITSKAPPFCRMDSNGDLECVVAFYSSNSLGELKVSVQDKSHNEVETILFKEIRNSWRNEYGECIGR